MPSLANLGSATLLGRPSATREEWEAAREADAADLNRLPAVDAYVVPLWSNADAPRCLQELRGFDDARVYVVPALGDDADLALAAVAESDWAGVALFGSPPFAPARGEVGGGERISDIAQLLHAAVGLELPLLLPDRDPDVALRVVALTLGEELAPREIEAVLRGEDAREPDADSRDWAMELLKIDAD